MISLFIKDYCILKETFSSSCFGVRRLGIRSRKVGLHVFLAVRRRPTFPQGLAISCYYSTPVSLVDLDCSPRTPYKSTRRQDRRIYLLLRQPKVWQSRNNSNRVCVAFAATPTLDTYHFVTLAKNPKLDRLLYTPRQTLVHVFLPIRFVEVRFLFWKQEWVYSTIQVGVLSRISRIKDSRQPVNLLVTQ